LTEQGIIFAEQGILAPRRQVLGGEIRTAVRDPPYNVQIDGHVSGKGKIRHREFDIASGEMTPPPFY